MTTFEINISKETFRVMPNRLSKACFSVFNHSTFHVIEKKSAGGWEIIEHRFGKDNIPLIEIGEAIDKHAHEKFIG